MLLITLTIGLLGAFLMFCGDMILYYDKNDFEQNGTLDPIINIMKKLPKKRVMVGGLIGPVAAFLYCIGFYHMVLITKEPFYMLSFAAFLLSCMGIIAGGAYHSHCAYLGLLVDCKANNYTNIQHCVIMNTSKFTEVFSNGKSYTLSPFK